MKSAAIHELNGQTVKSIKREEGKLLFVLDDDREFLFTHDQDCCEHVWLSDVTGDWKDVIGQKIIAAHETANRGETDYGSETWTFYTIVTFMGNVTLRWCGESNGYYSESVDLYWVDSEEEEGE